MQPSRVVSLDQLQGLARSARSEGRRVVLCHGTFDLLHVGHIRHLRRARDEGDLLLVSITGDRYVNKGPGRPVFSEQMRAEALAALACVDGVAIHQGASGIEVIEALRPHVYAKGSDYAPPAEDLTGNLERERRAVEALGGRLFFTDEITFSSTSLLNEHFGVFPPETRQFLRSFAARHPAEAVIEAVRGLRPLRALVVGDAIIDEYHYATPLGQPTKGQGLAVSFDSAEQFAGGALAVANHLGSFCDQVTLATGIGADAEAEHFLRSRLQKSVEPRFFVSQRSGTLIKRRFVDADLNKLFEVYLRDGEDSDPEVEARALRWLDQNAADFDLLVVPDFGNGFISRRMVEVLCQRARFLAVNTQLNAGNRGFHAIHRYARASFVSLNEPELRLAAHNRSDPVELLAEAVAAQVGCEAIAVTRGVKGLVLHDRRRGEHIRVPALSTRVVDRIGAGDAFLSLAALGLAGGLSGQVAAFVGSAAAALDVQIVCNREPVSSVKLFKYVTTLLK